MQRTTTDPDHLFGPCRAMPAAYPAASWCPLPVQTGPRLQTGDLVVITPKSFHGKPTTANVFRVASLQKTKCILRAFGRPARDFSVPLEYALARRQRALRKMPHTIATHLLLRRGDTPPSGMMLCNMATEGGIDTVDRQGLTALMMAVLCESLETVVTLVQSRGACIDATDPDGETHTALSARRGPRGV